MIEKIEIENIANSGELLLGCAARINALIDRVEDIATCVNLGIGLDNIKNNDNQSAIPTKCFSEQKKWIGSLVEYGNADEGFHYGILVDIIEKNHCPFKIQIGKGYIYTKNVWLPDSTVYYKGK